MNKTLTSIVYTHTSCLFEEVPEYYVTEINGEIIFINENDEDTIGGKVKYFFINIKNSVFKADYLLDLVSNTEPFIGEIYRPDGFSFKKKIENLSMFGMLSLNLLILDRLEILPEFRGNNYSSRIIDDGIKMFGANAGLITLKAFPLQFEYKDENKLQSEWNKNMNLDILEKNEERALKKLIEFYKQLGFKKISSNNIMARVIE